MAGVAEGVVTGGRVQSIRQRRGTGRKSASQRLTPRW